MANRPVVKEILFQGIRIAVEYENGSVHQKTTPSGPVTHVFSMDYGFFPGAVLSADSGIPSDGDPLDAMVSPEDQNAPTAFVLLQKKGNDGQPAQVKVVLGTNEDGAIKLFLAHRPKELFGGVYGSLSVTSLRAALEDWKGTLPLEQKRMRPPRMITQLNRTIMHVLADVALTTDSLTPIARRGFDAVIEVESTMTRGNKPGNDWSRKHAEAMFNPSGHVRTIDEASRRIDFISSTSEIDRYNSIIEQDWRLENYRANPIVLWCHDCDGLPVGTTVPESLRTDKLGANDVLLSTVQVATAKENPIAEWVFQCYLSGALRAISVRFNPEGYQWEEVQGRSVCHYMKPELIEQSLCTVPGNASTLAVRDLKDLQSRMIQALERTALIIAPSRSYSIPTQTTTPAAPAVRTQHTETNPMPLSCKARDASVTHLLRHGVLEETCPGCKAELAIEVLPARDLEVRVQQAAVETSEAKARAAESDKRLSETTTRALAAEAKYAELERKLETLTKDLASANELAATARKDADAATRRTAELELSMIVGPAAHEISPVEQRNLADLAIVDQKKYTEMRDEAFRKYQRATNVDPAKALLAGGSEGRRGAPPAGAPPIGADPTPPWLNPPHQRDAGGFGQPGGAPPPAPPGQTDYERRQAELHGAPQGPAISFFDQVAATVG